MAHVYDWNKESYIHLYSDDGSRDSKRGSGAGDTRSSSYSPWQETHSHSSRLGPRETGKGPGTSVHGDRDSLWGRRTRKHNTLETAGATLTKVSTTIQWGATIHWGLEVWISQQWWAAGEQCVGISRKLGPWCRPGGVGEKQHTRASNGGPWELVSVTRLLCCLLFFVCCNQSIRNCWSPGSRR